MAMKKASRGAQRNVTSQATDDPADEGDLDVSELIGHYRQEVTEAQIWERPLKQNPNAQVVGIVHQGVVVRMKDGKSYLVHKFDSGEGDGSSKVVIANASKMGKNWARVKTKNVKNSKLEDYKNACGDNYDLTSDNCQHAVKRMWDLN